MINFFLNIKIKFNYTLLLIINYFFLILLHINNKKILK